MIKRFEQFILENTNSIIETIEDCMLNFCDEYDLDIKVEEGQLVNNNYIDNKLLPELIEMAKNQNVVIDIKKCYRINIIPKEHRQKEFFIQGNPGKMPELGDKWKESINDDFTKCIYRIKTLTSLYPNRVPDILKSNWSITFALV